MRTVATGNLDEGSFVVPTCPSKSVVESPSTPSPVVESEKNGSKGPLDPTFYRDSTEPKDEGPSLHGSRVSRRIGDLFRLCSRNWRTSTRPCSETDPQTSSASDSTLGPHFEGRLGQRSKQTTHGIKGHPYTHERSEEGLSMFFNTDGKGRAGPHVKSSLESLRTVPLLRVTYHQRGVPSPLLQTQCRTPTTEGRNWDVPVGKDCQRRDPLHNPVTET